jgi:hypothetical protein
MIGLLLTLGPAILVFAGIIAFSLHIKLMLAGAIIWFVTAPLWIKKQKSA